MTLLPPGQRKVNGFPRFGTHLHRPPPAIPPNPTITVTGAIRAPLTLELINLDGLPQVEAGSRLSLRRRLVGHRIAVGGGRFRHPLPQADRASADSRRDDHARGVPRVGRLQLDRPHRGRPGRGRTRRHPTRRTAHQPGPRRAHAAGEPESIRVHQHQALANDRSAHPQAARRPPVHRPHPFTHEPACGRRNATPGSRPPQYARSTVPHPPDRPAQRPQRPLKPRGDSPDQPRPHQGGIHLSHRGSRRP